MLFPHTIFQKTKIQKEGNFMKQLHILSCSHPKLSFHLKVHFAYLAMTLLLLLLLVQTVLFLFIETALHIIIHNYSSLPNQSNTMQVSFYFQFNPSIHKPLILYFQYFFFYFWQIFVCCYFVFFFLDKTIYSFLNFLGIYFLY